MVMQCPGERAMPFSISCQSSWVMLPGPQVRPVLPGVRPRPQRGATPVPAQHRPGRHEQRRQVHRRRAHQQPRGRLVAAAHQHRAVHRVGPQQLLGLHRQQIPVQHRRRLLERLRQRHRRHLHREPTGRPHPALDILHTLLEMRVARIDVTPGIDDRDHRLAPVIRGVETHLRGTRTVPERAHVGGAVPPVTAEIFRHSCGARETTFHCWASGVERTVECLYSGAAAPSGGGQQPQPRPLHPIVVHRQLPRQPPRGDHQRRLAQLQVGAQVVQLHLERGDHLPGAPEHRHRHRRLTGAPARHGPPHCG